MSGTTADVPLISYALFSLENEMTCPKGIASSLLSQSAKQLLPKALLKKIVISLVSVSVVVGGAFWYLNSLDETIELISPQETIELGESISTDPSHYLSTTNENVLNETVISYNLNEEDYPPLGEHEIKISYRKQELIFKIIVKDTIEPKFIQFEERLDFEEGSQEPDFLSYFKAEDLSDFELSLDKADLDMNAVGEYKLVIYATDISGNKSSMDFIVNITEKEVVEDTAKPVVEKQTPQNKAPVAQAPSNPIVDKAISLVGTVNEGGFGASGIGGSFVCDDLATVALAAGGINYSQLRSSGTVYSYSQAQPGDLLVYTPIPGSGVGGHVAIYIGNGMAVHGNFDRVTTIFSATGLTGLQEPYVLR